MRVLHPPILLPLIFFILPSQSLAILLDCEVRDTGVYQCIEISETEGTATPTADEEDYGAAYTRFREQAKTQCTYTEPRRRAGGKNTGALLRSEELKSARKDYEQCINDTARTLWKQHKRGSD